MSASKILFFLCLAFVAGVFLQTALKIPQNFVLGILFLSVLIIFVSFVLTAQRVEPLEDLARLLGFCLLVMVLGILRAEISQFEAGNNKLSLLNGREERIILEGTVVDDPAFGENSQKLKVAVNLPGEKNNSSLVLITTSRYPEYNYLDILKISGKFESPEAAFAKMNAKNGLDSSLETGPVLANNYKNYLAKDKIYSVMSFPRIELIGQAEKNFSQKIYSMIFLTKENLRQSIRKFYLPPQSSILEGTIAGDSGAISKELKDKLNITGLRHIVAVSGTHIVILGAILMPLFLMLGLWRGQAFYLSVVIIWLYIVLTGLSASGIRAGIMGTIFLLAEKLGRQKSAGRIIVLAAAVMLAINPLLLLYDIGFQLSFLAALGLICLDPILKGFLNAVTKNKAENAIGMVSSTICAQVFTLPILAYSFGNASIIAPVTNILILPIVSPLMIFGFLSSFFGIFSNILGWIFFAPTWVLLTYFVKILDFFSQPWMAVTMKNVSWPWMAFYYIVIISLWYLNKKYRNYIV